MQPKKMEKRSVVLTEETNDVKYKILVLRSHNKKRHPNKQSCLTLER